MTFQPRYITKPSPLGWGICRASDCEHVAPVLFFTTKLDAETARLLCEHAFMDGQMNVADRIGPTIEDAPPLVRLGQPPYHTDYPKCNDTGPAMETPERMALSRERQDGLPPILREAVASVAMDRDQTHCDVPTGPEYAKGGGR